jgi:hypothetical protein
MCSMQHMQASPVHLPAYRGYGMLSSWTFRAAADDGGVWLLRVILSYDRMGSVWMALYFHDVVTYLQPFMICLINV